METCRGLTDINYSIKNLFATIRKNTYLSKYIMIKYN